MTTQINRHNLCITEIFLIFALTYNVSFRIAIVHHIR